MIDLANMKNTDFKYDDVNFELLMSKRIRKILLVCSTYDAFMLEEDGRIDERIFMDYVKLHLRYPPQFIKVTSAKAAIEALEEPDNQIDLVISMLSVSGGNAFALAKVIKETYGEKMPVVVLTPFSREVSQTLKNEDQGGVDYVFSWLGDTDLLLAIVKLIEDRNNADNDIEKGVRYIMLIENSVRNYSTYLPVLYKTIFEESKQDVTEALTEHQRTMQMRARPKILLARNYTDADEIYQKYPGKMLGIISDGSFNITKTDKEEDSLAGYKFLKIVRAADEYVPVLFQSSEEENEPRAAELNAKFIRKHTSNDIEKLREFIRKQLGFGKLVFKDPNGIKSPIIIKDLKDLQEKIDLIPDDAFRYHLGKHHVSKWLKARALFTLSESMRKVSIDDFTDLNHLRKFLYNSIAAYRQNSSKGIIAEFVRDNYDEYLTFARLGKGSLGGKARGLAFLDTMIKKHNLAKKYEDVSLSIPRSLVISTEIFSEFMKNESIQKILKTKASDEEILQIFVDARFATEIHWDILAFLHHIDKPVAIRSSSLLEDSHYQPFAGIYSTYMLPDLLDKSKFAQNLAKAIKSVYASVYFSDSRSYIEATKNVIDEEKMAVVLQEVCGRKYGNRFYPTFSGVARSINFYPVGDEKAEDGVITLALGLGKHIVEGSVALRFSPKLPKKAMQLSSVEYALRDTQKEFYALDLTSDELKTSTNEGINLLKLTVDDAEQDGSLTYIASTFDHQNHILRPGIGYTGKRVISFAGVLHYDLFPLCNIISDVLKIGKAEMNADVEIEFAVDLDPAGKNKPIVNLLQIRPIVNNSEVVNTDLKAIEYESTLLYSHQALGNGIYENVSDIVFVKPDVFDASKTQLIAEKVDEINKKFIEADRNYVLIGPGRWGSSDPWLGVPVKWPHISQARVIAESGLHNFRIDPSQGTHFFQNLTSFKVGYLTLNPYINDGYYDIEFLKSCKPTYEDEYLCHIHFDKPLKIMIDGQKNIGVIMKPEQ